MKNQAEEINILQLYLKELAAEAQYSTDFDTNDKFKNLIKLEKEFAKCLRSFKEGREVYRAFVYYINVESSDLREARGYFRERLSNFMPVVNKAIKRANMKDMYRLPINFRFCAFAMRKLEGVSGPKKDKVSKLMNEMSVIRNEIINQYLYMALNKAKVFSSKNKSGSVDFSDFISAANEGLLNAVDKYVLGANSKFHQMAVGFILSHLLTVQTSHSSAATLGSHGQKKLYSLKKALQKQTGSINVPELSEVLKIAEEDIADLINSTKYFSLDAPINGYEDHLVSDFVDLDNGEAASAYDLVEAKNLLLQISENIDKMSIVQKKILVLKGVIKHEDIT
jgi:DNA-directed RNA polymerase specialized sigma subunit